MSISVTFYTFSKEVNSTAQPAGAGTSFDCVLRSDTSVISPSIELMTTGNPCSYNYCHISDFGRYYFVQDWISVKGRWVAKLTVDVLATYKSAITASSQYVSRSASEKDEYISDGFYPVKTESGSSCFDYDSDSTLFDYSDMCFVVGILGDNNPIGSVTYYLMSSAQLTSLISYMSSTYSQWSGISISDYTEAIQKALINPFQYVVSCHAMPLKTAATVAKTKIKFGPYEYTTNCATLNAMTTYQRSKSFTVPKHPDAATTGKYLNCSPFTSYTAFVGPFGEIPIDPFIVQDSSTLNYLVDFDFISGDAILRIFSDNGQGTVITRTAHVAVDIPLSAAVSNINKQIIGGMNVLSSLTPNITAPVAGSASNIMSAVYDYAQAFFPQVECRGSQGSFVGWIQPVGLAAKFCKTVEIDNTHNGSPLMKVKTLSTLSGFTVVMNPDIAISGTSEESEAIKNFMTSGFYID